jgi:hypothetical protein
VVDPAKNASVAPIDNTAVIPMLSAVINNVPINLLEFCFLEDVFLLFELFP